MKLITVNPAVSQWVHRYGVVLSLGIGALIGVTWLLDGWQTFTTLTNVAEAAWGEAWLTDFTSSRWFKLFVAAVVVLSIWRGVVPSSRKIA
jgi:hypothetical protein